MSEPASIHIEAQYVEYSEVIKAVCNIRSDRIRLDLIVVFFGFSIVDA